jgi:nucleoside 2-deoxyribosyltransferase
VKFYLAASFIRFKELQTYRTILKRYGHAVTSRWLNGDHQMDVGGMGSDPDLAARFGQEDLDDVIAADILIMFVDPPREGTSRGGRHTEFGIALAKDKTIFLIGQPENVFHWLPGVHQYDSWEDFEAMTLGLT